MGFVMPREDRRVYFDMQESYRAVYSFCEHKSVSKPVSGVLQKVEVNLESPLDLDFHIESNRSGKTEVFVYSVDFVVAALMMLCKESKIPLPKGVNKNLEITKDNLILRVQLIR